MRTNVALFFEDFLLRRATLAEHYGWRSRCLPADVDMAAQTTTFALAFREKEQ
jgi:hypothetical protein